MKVVRDAINSGDYQQLNEQVQKTVPLIFGRIIQYSGKLQNGIMEMRRSETDCRKVWRRAWTVTAGVESQQMQAEQVTYRTNYSKDHTPAYQAGAWKRTQQGKQLPVSRTESAGKNHRNDSPSQDTLWPVCTPVLLWQESWQPFIPVYRQSLQPQVGITAASLGMGMRNCDPWQVRRFRQYSRSGDRAYVSKNWPIRPEDETKVRKDLKLMIEKNRFCKGVSGSERNLSDRYRTRCISSIWRRKSRRKPYRCSNSNRKNNAPGCRKSAERSGREGRNTLLHS